MREGVCFLLGALCLAALCQRAICQNKVIMCYYTNWSQYRSGRNFFPEDINPRLCTHLVYAFANLNNNQLVPFEWNDFLDYGDGGLYRRFQNLKLINPSVKTLLAVGGWTVASAPFVAMTATAANRAQFVDTSITYLRTYGFDGLDLDWEYPGSRGGIPADKVNYIELLKDLRQGFQTEATATGRERLLLTAAVPAGYSNVEAGYNVPQVNAYLDYINLMSYDLHGAWDSFVGHNAPLYGAVMRDGSIDTLSVSAVTMNWVNRGASREKLLVGLPTYGRVFRLSNPSDTEPFAAASGAGTRGVYTRESGFLSYYEICTLINQGGYTTRRDTTALAPYAYSGDQWISYDDIESIRTKMTWMNDNGFGGAIVWAIELDDFPYNGNPLCGQGPYPLLNVISNCLMNGLQCSPSSPVTTPAPATTPAPVTTPFVTSPTSPTSPTTPAPVTTPFITSPTTSPTTTSPVSSTGDPDCPQPFGFFRYPYDCRRYWFCVLPAGKWHFPCGSGTAYDPNIKLCTASALLTQC